MLKLIYIFGHVLTVSSRCYGRCYVKKTYTTVNFPLISHSPRDNSARLFQNVFNKCSRVLNLVFSKTGIFHEHRHIFELFFCKKKYLLVGASGMLWTGQWVSESVSE